MVRAGYEFEAREKFTEGFISGPLGETLGIRVAAKYSSLDGWTRNVVPPTASVSYPGLTIPGAVRQGAEFGADRRTAHAQVGPVQRFRRYAESHGQQAQRHLAGQFRSVLLTGIA